METKYYILLIGMILLTLSAPLYKVYREKYKINNIHHIKNLKRVNNKKFFNIKGIDPDKHYIKVNNIDECSIYMEELKKNGQKINPIWKQLTRVTIWRYIVCKNDGWQLFPSIEGKTDFFNPKEEKGINLKTLNKLKHYIKVDSYEELNDIRSVLKENGEIVDFSLKYTPSWCYLKYERGKWRISTTRERKQRYNPYFLENN